MHNGGTIYGKVTDNIERGAKCQLAIDEPFELSRRELFQVVGEPFDNSTEPSGLAALNINGDCPTPNPSAAKRN